MKCRLECATIHYEEAGKGEKPPRKGGGFSGATASRAGYLR